MRHFALYFGLATVLVASCSLHEEDFYKPHSDDIPFYASFEQPVEDDTRVYANENLLLRWTADDRVSIFNMTTVNQQYAFNGDTGDDTGGFDKVAGSEFTTGKTISHVVSVYPYQSSTKISDSEIITVTLPAEQHYAENSFGLGANTMVSVSADNFLQYKNVGGYLMLKLYGENVSVSSITLKGNNGEKLAGKALVAMPQDGVPTLTMADDAVTEIVLTCDSPVRVGATVEESSHFWFVIPPVTFSKGFTITVKGISGGSFEKSTSKIIEVERNKLAKMSAIGVEIPLPIPGAVDLGLPSGVLWATSNLGATTAEEDGDYYAWGETEPYYLPSHSLDNPCSDWKEGKEKGYTWWSYKWCMGTAESLIKYCNRESYGHQYFCDDKIRLDPEDDAAHVNLGGDWRTPTVSNWSELYENCEIKWTEQNGVAGMLFTSIINGNSIFFPFAGYRTSKTRYSGPPSFYWTSSLDTKNPSTARAMRLSYEGSYGESFDRCEGLSVRPVYDNGIHPESVALNKSSLSITVGATERLTATITPANVTNNTVLWSSSDPSIASVDDNGVVTGVNAGTVRIVVTTNDGRLNATCDVTVYAIPAAVDLGLPSGLKWASFNLGASKPEECGYYYAWGETDKKSDYSWYTYKWCMEESNKLTKYCFSSEYGYNGFTDGKTVMDPEDDAAYVNLGERWRMPTSEDWSELSSNCQFLKTFQNSVDGILITSNINGNSIFLPSSGYMEGTQFYSWSFSVTHYVWLPSLDENFPHQAWCGIVDYGGIGSSCTARCIGYPIRPVYSE